MVAGHLVILPRARRTLDDEEAAPPGGQRVEAKVERGLFSPIHSVGCRPEWAKEVIGEYRWQCKAVEDSGLEFRPDY